MLLATLEILFKSFEGHSIVWIIISLGIGGIITEIVKFLFEQTLPEAQ